MSDKFKIGARVVVTDYFGENRYRGEHGKVIGEAYGNFLGKKVPVKLDKYGQENISEGDLRHEELNSQEVLAEINKVEKQVKQVADKLPEETRTELPNHIRYFKEAQASNNKKKAVAEFNYLAPSLQIVSEIESIPKSWWLDVEISLDKINWWIKTSK